MIQARFDTNEFGQYLGTATIIYAKASAALRAVNDYNGASLDNRVMRVYYAEEQQNRPEPAKPQNLQSGRHQRDQLRRQERRDKTVKVRRTGGHIHKNRDSDRDVQMSHGNER